MKTAFNLLFIVLFVISAIILAGTVLIFIISSIYYWQSMPLPNALWEGVTTAFTTFIIGFVGSAVGLIGKVGTDK